MGIETVAIYVISLNNVPTPAMPSIDFAWLHTFIACSLYSIIYWKHFSPYVFQTYEFLLAMVYAFKDIS